MTAQQRKVLDVLTKHGPCSSLHLASQMRREYPDRSWGIEMTRKVLRQLQYRSLVEYDVQWRIVPTD